MLNVAALNGRLTAEPELRHTQTEKAVCNFTLAVDRSYQKPGQERQADFIDIVAWGAAAEFVAKYFHKGQLVAVEGTIQTRSYTDKEGNKRKATEIVTNQVHFAEPRRSQENRAGNPDEIRQNANSSGLDVGEIPPLPSAGDHGDFVEIAGDDDLPF